MMCACFQWLLLMFVFLEADSWSHSFLGRRRKTFYRSQDGKVGNDNSGTSRRLYSGVGLPSAADVQEEAVVKRADSECVPTVDQVLNAYSMPWSASIDPRYSHRHLFYMPFWEWQIAFMKKNLKNLRIVPSINRLGTKDLAYVENKKKRKRMITLCFRSEEYRLIRMTLLDAGTATQVFTSLWYPRANLPVLGIDLLQFNEKKHLTVVDFQPIHQSEECHDSDYEHLLRPIRSLYPSLQNQMTKRFYNENQFFSSEMLLGRGTSSEYVWRDLMPAYMEYVKTHLQLTREYQCPNDRMGHVLKPQRHTMTTHRYYRR